MKKREMSNQLKWIAKAVQYWTFKSQKGIYGEKNLWRIRELAKKKLLDLYLHIYKVINVLDWELESDKKDKQYRRETMKTIKEYDEIHGIGSWYEYGYKETNNL